MKIKATINFEGFKNGHHEAKEEEFSHWFRVFIKVILRANLAKVKRQPAYVTCLGRYCRGKKMFRSQHEGHRICPKCKPSLKTRKPLTLNYDRISKEFDRREIAA